MTPNQLIEVLNNLTPEEKNLPMIIEDDLATYYNEEIRSVVIEHLSDGGQLVYVSACAAGYAESRGIIVRVAWASD